MNIYKYITGLFDCKLRYDMIFSLGSACHCAMHLRDLGLRQYSYPFDWIAPDESISGFNGLDMKISLLCNGFGDWFRKEDFVWVNANTVHDWYKNVKTGFSFNHEFPKGKFEESFAGVKEKYERRVERLFSHLNCSTKTLAVYTQDTWDQKRDPIKYLPDSKFIEYSRLLNEKFDHVDMLLFEHDPNLGKNEIVKYQINKQILRVRSNHNYTENNMPLGHILGIKKVLKKYALSGKL